MADNNNNERAEVHSLSVRAGKRTYFFDIRATKDENLYLTITESKKKMRNDGTFFYEKHKIFLYKEDLEKFTNGLKESVDYIKENNPTPVVESTGFNGEGREDGGSYTNVNFEDIDK